MDSISPAILSGCGVLRLSKDDIGWRLIVQNWISQQPKANKEILTDLSRRYIEKTIDFLSNEKVVRQNMNVSKSVVGYNHSHRHLQHAVSMTEKNMVQNLIAIFEVSISGEIKHEIYSLNDVKLESPFYFTMPATVVLLAFVKKKFISSIQLIDRERLPSFRNASLFLQG